MLKRLIVGVALLTASAAPAFCGYIPFSDAYSYTGNGSLYFLMHDGDSSSYGYNYWTSINPMYFYVPAGVKGSAIRLDWMCVDGALSKTVMVHYADGTTTSSVLYTTDSVRSTQFALVGYPYKELRPLNVSDYAGSATVEIYPTIYPTNAICYVYEAQLFSPTDSFSAVITTDSINSLLQSATFQTTITSVAAVSDIADYLTFASNENGGKAAFMFGTLLAIMFIIGIRMGMLS